MSLAKSHFLTSALHALATVLATIILPMAFPAFFFERTVNRWKAGWRFDHRTGTPYFLALSMVATGLVAFAGSMLCNVLGLYLLTAMEMLALWVSVALASGHSGHIFHMLRPYARRSYESVKGQKPFSRTVLYIGVISYGYTVFYFGLVNLFLYGRDPCAFIGVDGESPFSKVWEFLYYSVVTITTLGYGDITPEKFLTQASAVAEVALGLFFIISIFGAFVSFHVNRLSEAEDR